MKKNNILLATGILLLVMLVVWIWIDYDRLNNEQTELIKTVDLIKVNTVDIKRQLQNIQDNYVSYDDLQPVLTLFDDYQLEVDQIRNNLNDFNGLWDQMFNYKAPKYELRGSD